MFFVSNNMIKRTVMEYSRPPPSAIPCFHASSPAIKASEEKRGAELRGIHSSIKHDLLRFTDSR